KTASTSFTLVVRDVPISGTGPLIVGVNGMGRISPNLNGRALTFGRVYTMTAIPGLGQRFAGWTGGVNSAAPRLTFVMQSGLILQANFVPNPFLPVAGIYSGLFYEPTRVQQESSGFFAATVTERGTFSGRLQLAGRTYPLSGQFDTEGRALKLVPRPQTNGIILDLSLDLANGTDQITGTLSDGEWMAEISADRAPVRAPSEASPFTGK